MQNSRPHICPAAGIEFTELQISEDADTGACTSHRQERSRGINWPAAISTVWGAVL